MKGAVVIGHSALARELMHSHAAMPWDGESTLPVGRYDVVVQAASTSVSSGADAWQEDIEQTRAAIALAEQIGGSVVLVSKLSVAGTRTGLINEDDPRRGPFGGRTDKDAPTGMTLDVDQELDALSRALAWASQRANHADTAAQLTKVTHERLRKEGGASSGTAFESAMKRALSAHVKALSAAALTERAAGWGFATGSGYGVRGYTLALAELLVARASVPWCIVRVADTLESPHGALATVVERVQDGVSRFPFVDDSRLEALPLTRIAESVALCARALVDTKLTGVVHVCTGEREVLGTERLLDLIDLHLHKHQAKQGRASARGPRLLAVTGVDRMGERNAVVDGAMAVAGTGLSMVNDLISEAMDRGPLPAAFKRVVQESSTALRGLVEAAPADRTLCQSPPFVSSQVRYSQRGLRAAAVKGQASATAASNPLEWRPLLLDEVLPKLQQERARVIAARPHLPRAAYDSLAHLLIEVADRYGTKPALSMIQPPGAEPVVVDVSYRHLLERARAVALRLQRAGVKAGERVIVAGSNHPSWAIAAFGVVLARCTLVPFDPNLDAEAARRIATKAKVALCIVDRPLRQKWSDALEGVVREGLWDLQLTTVDGPGIAADAPRPHGNDVASILFTSGTTGDPKGVMLTHKNFCALLASLQAVFPTTEADRMLSVLPLHHTFEFSCGLLMPLASGARIFTPDALTGERVLFALKHGKITALVGVPALWQLLERRITKQASERGELLKTVFGSALSLNRAFGKKTGMSFGNVVLKQVHDELGGHLRVLISGGSALPPAVHELFQGLGLPLAEGYGLTESAPVLTVAEGKMGLPAGTVGKPIPGVELKIVDADPITGVGEVWARADNVMKGYFEDDAATRAAIDDGWLKTGDLGVINSAGVLKLVGRSKDVVVSASGENIYLDDVEKKLEDIAGVAELTLLGIADPRGGERLALAFVVAEAADATAALDAVKLRLNKLAAFQRPAVVEAVAGPLPRTSTRKVKRKQVRETIEALAAQRAAAVVDAAPAFASVRSAIALVSGLEVNKLSGHTKMQGDLGFDSLMWVELQGSLAGIAAIEPEVLAQQETVAAVEAYVRTRLQVERAPSGAADDDAAASQPKRAWSDVLFAVAKPLGRAAITTVQREAYRTVFDSAVTGRAFIPHNRNSIVIANHTSHLDTGLVKFALGRYGENLRPLAAKDYFFEGARAKVAFFEHFTNLVPIDRETGSGLAFEQARAVVEQGHTVLIFPEGTRREDGTLGTFKPLVARLSLATNVDVLPVWMEGNFEALPRGTYVPNRHARHLAAHIGPPLAARELARLTAHLSNVQAARAATDVLRAAIVALSEGRMLELSRVQSLDTLSAGVVARPAA